MPSDRRRLGIAAVLAVAAVLLVVLLVRACGEDRHDAATPVRAGEPLAFVPAGAELVADVDLASPLPAVLVQEYAGLRDLPKRGRAVVARRGRLRWAFVQGATAASANGRPARVIDGVLLTANEAQALDAAVAARHAGARAAFDRRTSRMPRSAPVRIAFAPRPALAAISPKVAASAWGRNQQEGQAAIVPRGAELTVPFALTGVATPLRDLPFAPGPTVPRARGAAPIVLSLRDPARTLRFAEQAGLADVLRVVRRLPSFLEPELDDLGPDGTLTTADRKAVTLRLTPPDPGDWARKLDRLDKLSGLFRTLGLADVRIDRTGDAYTIEEGGRLALRAMVRGRVLVLSTDPAADLRAAADAPAAPAPPRARGALTATVAPALLLDELSRLVGRTLPEGVLRIGPLTATAIAEPRVVAGTLRVRITR